MKSTKQRLALVMLTCNRRDEVLHALARLHEEVEDRPVYLVDNASSDGTAAAVAERFPAVHVIRLAENRGAAGRNAGVRAADADYIAFCDDDTWWASGALRRAIDVLDAHPRLVAISARVLVGDAEREDDTCRRMAASPLPDLPGVPGRQLLGFMAGASVVRRDAFLAAGGYEPRLFLGREELLLALDWYAAGWRMAYVPELVVHHHPSPVRDVRGRRRLLARNALWCALLRRPWRSVARILVATVRDARRDPEALGGLVDAVRGLRWIISARRRLPDAVEQTLRHVEAFYAAESGERPVATTSCAPASRAG